MHEETRGHIYRLFAGRDISIERRDEKKFENFCCLKTRLYPKRVTTLMVGEFTDQLHEVLSLAHEFGHLLHYDTITGREAERVFCAVLASNYAGLENISDDGKRTIIALEKRASELALGVLRPVADSEMMSRAHETYSRWLRGYVEKAGLTDDDAFSLKGA
jgi:hypothetical protein